MAHAPSYRPDLPDFGIYAVWPSPGISWIHPHDVSTFQRLIPSRRVFERVRYDGTYYHLRYGRLRVRVRPSLWTRVPELDLRVGDRVELLSQFGRFEPGIVSVTEVFADLTCSGFQFVVRRGNMILPRYVTRDHFRLLQQTHRLRPGHGVHPTPKYLPPTDIELLNVGDLT